MEAEEEVEAEGQPQAEAEAEAALHPAFSCRPRPRSHETTCQECAEMASEGVCRG